MRRFFIFMFASLSCFHHVNAKKLRYASIALNNYATSKPFTQAGKVFYSQLHPGFTLSTGFNWNDKPKYNWLQTFKFGYFSHRYVQRSFVLYTEFGYRYKVGKSQKLGVTAAFGAGYLHMIPATEQFKQNEDGDWEKVKLKSRPQAMLSLCLGLDYKINKKGNRVFIRMQGLLQTPFVPGYVPFLPYNVFHLGMTFPIQTKTSK